ncbi:MAG: hypothetical protein AB1439_06720 [candidate division FCPU426 bacterium]
MRNARWVVGLGLAVWMGWGLGVAVYGQTMETSEGQTPINQEANDMKTTELMLFSLPYGFTSSPVDIHVYLSTQFWNYEYQALGKYANEGSSASGHSTIIPYSGYIDLASRVREDLKVEAEFELYKGESIKVCRLRGVWQPKPWLALSLGRDFGIIGLQDKLYYPTSKYKLFTIPPFLHLNVIRYTGWWDSGAFLHGEVPFPFLSEDGKVNLDVSVANGPGSTAAVVKKNAQGYMYEYFHDTARQASDNNNDKPVAVRCSVAPWKGLEFGGSYLNAKWDPDDRYFAQYTFSHFLFNYDRITVVAEYGQLKLDTPADGKVTQFSGYIAAGYEIFKNLPYLEALQPVVRYEQMDSWKEDPTGKEFRESISAGLRYLPCKGWQIKMAYQVIQEPKGPKLDNNGFAAEAVFEF